MTTNTKEALHRLIDALPDDEAERLLNRLEDPVARAFAVAPLGEPLTPDERARIERASQAYRHGEWLDGQDVRRAIGW